MDKKSPNPPPRSTLPATLEYLKAFQTESAYIPEKGKDETMIGYKKRLYNIMTILTGMSTDKLNMRIQTRWPTYDWKTIWHNLHTAPVNDTMKGEWYKIIHDLTPRNARLHKIHLSNTDKCKIFTMTDTLVHRITEFGEGDVTWEWARRKMAMIIRIDLKYIPK
jgi:hypothetical protein